jgi:hypothetical protein
MKSPLMNDRTMRTAAIRGALRDIDPISGRALMALAEAARRDPHMAAEMIENISDIGEFTAARFRDLPCEGPLALSAMRYSLGRSSYIASACASWLETNWAVIDRDAQAAIITDVTIALQNDRAGMSPDRKAWQELLIAVGAPVPAEKKGAGAGDTSF